MRLPVHLTYLMIVSGSETLGIAFRHRLLGGYAELRFGCGLAIENACGPNWDTALRN